MRHIAMLAALLAFEAAARAETFVPPCVGTCTPPVVDGAVDDLEYANGIGFPLSNFAATPGLRLPRGYHGHHENDRVPVRTLEHWLQACKVTSRQQFDLILACGSARAAKKTGRQTTLRPDWEQIKYQVMLSADCAASSPWSPTAQRSY